MKKLFTLAVIALTLTFTSCKKSYTCTCVTTLNGVSRITLSNINGTSGYATKKCNDFVDERVIELGYSVKCDIK